MNTHNMPPVLEAELHDLLTDIQKLDQKLDKENELLAQDTNSLNVAEGELDDVSEDIDDVFISRAVLPDPHDLKEHDAAEREDQEIDRALEADE
jgi:hypothetical protein